MKLFSRGSRISILCRLSLSLWLALGAAGPATAMAHVCPRRYTLALHDHGLLYSTNTDAGIDKDVADELIRRSGCKVTVSVMDRARIWQLIESGALDFSLSGITNAERDTYASFAWYFSDKYYLLVRKDADVRNLSDFLGNDRLTLGVIRSFRYGTSANNFVDRLQSENRVNRSNGLAPLYQALMLNQIQGMIIEPFDYPAIEQKQIRDSTRVLEFDDPAVPHGLIMSKRSLSPAEQARWRALIEGMRADGTMRRIFGKYFKPDLAAAMVDF